jgi:hypothetical protein
MASLSSCGDRNTPRSSRFFARLAKKPSMTLSHEADVGVKWKMKRWMLADKSKKIPQEQNLRGFTVMLAHKTGSHQDTTAYT